MKVYVVYSNDGLPDKDWYMIHGIFASKKKAKKYLRLRGWYKDSPNRWLHKMSNGDCWISSYPVR